MEILLVTFVRLLNRPNSYDQFWKWIPMALPGEINITCLGCQLSAGQSGSAGIKCVLKKKIRILVLSYILPAHLCAFGQDYTLRKRGKRSITSLTY
jgi:hypothetical protein